MDKLNLRLVHLRKIVRAVANIGLPGKKPPEDEAIAFESAGHYFLSQGGVGEPAKLEMAKFCYRIAAELDPTWAKPVLRLAGIVGDQGNHDEAIKLYQECLRLGCKGLDLSYPHENPYYEMGLCYAALGRPDEAEAWFLAGLGKGYQRDDFYNWLSFLWHRERAYDLAVKYYREWLAFREGGGHYYPDLPPSTEVMRRALELAEHKKPVEDLGELVRNLEPRSYHTWL